LKPAVPVLARQDAPAPAAAAATPEERIRDIFVTVQKALKQRRLYESKNKIYQATIELLGEKFAAYLVEFHDLTVAVTVDALVTEKEMHLAGQKREASIPFKLFRDGVRSLRFLDGLTVEEISKLLNVLDTPLDGPGRSFDEDMASILWLQGFEHIEITSVDEIGQPEKGDGKGKVEGGGDQSEMVASLSRGVEEMLESLKKGTLLMSEDGADSQLAPSGDHLVSAGRRDIFEMDRLSTPSAVAEEANDLFEVPAVVMAKLRAEADDQGALVRRILDIICDLFREGQCSRSVEDVQVLISQLLRDNLARQDLAAVNGALDNLNAKPGTRVDESASRLLAGLLAGLVSDDAMAMVFAAADTGSRKAHEELLKLLTRLPSGVVKHCALHLHSLKTSSANDVCLQVLRGRGREDVPALIACLEKQPEDDLVEVIRAVLASGEAPSVASELRDLLGHEQERVRLDALRVCSSLASQSSKPLIETALADASPKVRFVAMRMAERSKDRGFLPILLRRFDACRLDDDEERIRLVRCIAGLGGQAAVECLREIFGSRRPWWIQWFVRARRWRREAIANLADVTDEAVMAYLAEGASSWDRPFAEACKTALKTARNRSVSRR